MTLWMSGGSTMLYIVAVLLPPLAVLVCRKPFQALLNLLLCLFFYIPGMIHALMIVHDHYADRRSQKLLRAMEYRYE